MRFYVKEDIRSGMVIPDAWIWQGKVDNGWGMHIRLPWWARKPDPWETDRECTCQLTFRIDHTQPGPEKYEWIWWPIWGD